MMHDLAKAAVPSVPLHDVPEFPALPAIKPRYATVREIDFALQNGDRELVFFFSRADFRVQVNNHGELLNLLCRIRDNQFDYDDTIDKEPRPPYTSRLTLGNNRDVYVIYRLSDAKNWQFASEFAPISLGDKAANSNRYFEARRLDRNGNLDRVINKIPVKERCVVSYFIAMHDNYGNFEDHAINIHVDLLYNGTTNRIPIVIDPDIRHPGGSGP